MRAASLGSLLLPLALIALACGPKHTPETATQRFPTEAPVPDVLRVAADVLQARGLSIVAETPTYVCAERWYPDIRYTPMPSNVYESRAELARAWRLVHVNVVDVRGTAFVTVVPSPSFVEGVRVRFPDEVFWVGHEEARRSWCADPRGEDTPLNTEQVSLSEAVASLIRMALQDQDGSMARRTPRVTTRAAR